MQTERFKYLLSQYITGKISMQEHDEFLALVRTGIYDNLLADATQKELLREDAGHVEGLPSPVSTEIVQQIFEAGKAGSVLPHITKPVFRIRKYWIAAAVLLLVATAGYWLMQGGPQVWFVQQVESNTSDSSRTVFLPDSSIVVLSPHSQVSYSKEYNESLREVRLQGEGFFKVTKNPKKPFLVYYNDIVTKVLGTSFVVGINKKTGNPEVCVKSGRVQVYDSKLPSHTIIVTPNQKAIYQPAGSRFETAIVNTPQPLLPEDVKEAVSVTNNSLRFDKEKLSVIFSQLSALYGIKISLANPMLADCVFTGELSGKDLFIQLKIICIATNATYEVNGLEIVIKGSGCK